MLVDDIEFFSLSKELKLTAGFELLTAKQQGFVVDGVWKDQMTRLVADQVCIPPQGHEADAVRVSNGRPADVKWFTGVRYGKYENNASVYLSHNEYLYGKEHDTVYVIFCNRGGAGFCQKVFAWSAAKEVGAIQPYREGTWAFCKRTGKEEPPWSIELFLLDPFLRDILK